MEGGFLKTALIFLASAVVFVPIAKKLGMGSVIGYLAAGIIIGPYVFKFVGGEGQDIMHAAEFGVVMLLFLIGLELKPREFWKNRRTIAGIGMLQLVLTTTLLGALTHLWLGFPIASALAVSLALTMSSTAIVLQTLKEKGLSGTSGGESSFAVLLFQDIAVIPILALLPLLTSPGTGQADPGHSLIDSLPGGLQTLFVAGAVAIIFVAGKFIVVPLLREISKTRLREMFTAAALLLIVGVAFLMQVVGLSPALGAFLAGLVLANSEFKHELESDLEPFKGLLLGLFFIGVGASINFSLIAHHPAVLFSLVLLVMVIKAVILFVTGMIFGLKKDQNLLFAILLSQVGEFAFVLLTFSNQLKLLDSYWTEILMATTAITMAISPLLLLINERLIDPYFGIRETGDTRTPDAIEGKYPVIVAGFGHFGSTIGRFLRANGIQATILDNDSDRVELLRKMGFTVYYGDATRLDLLRSAGAESARLLIAAIDSPETNAALVGLVKKHFPHMEIMARARNRYDAYDLIDLGVKDIYRETLYTSVFMAIDVLQKLGFRKYTATRKALDFIRYDEAALVKLSKHRHEIKDYVINVKEQIEMQEKLLSEDLHLGLTSEDRAWDSEPMRREE